MPSLSQNISTLQDSDFQKCGEIMVAPKRNAFAMSCNYCESIFKRLPAFLRHLHQNHMDELEFEAEVEVYAVEELVNRTLSAVQDVDSEESGVADDDDDYDYEHRDSPGSENAEEDKDKYPVSLVSSLNRNDKPNVLSKHKGPKRDVVKKATLANMSILNALEDCDVSLNFVENLDNTIVEKQEDETEPTPNITEKIVDKEIVDKEEKVTNTEGKTEECMEIDEEEEDIDMESTILRRIKMDLDLDVENVQNPEETTKNESVQILNKEETKETSDVDNVLNPEETTKNESVQILNKEETKETSDADNVQNPEETTKDESVQILNKEETKETSDADNVQNPEETTKNETVQNLNKEEAKETSTQDDCNSSTEEEDANVTLTETNIGETLKTSSSGRVRGLKNLLSGLEELDDVEDLIDNMEDSMMVSKVEEEELEENLEQKQKEEIQQTKEKEQQTKSQQKEEPEKREESQKQQDEKREESKQIEEIETPEEKQQKEELEMLEEAQQKEEVVKEDSEKNELPQKEEVTKTELTKETLPQSQDHDDEEFDDFNLNASILKQCLADDCDGDAHENDAADEKLAAEKEEPNENEPINEKNKTNEISAFNLQVMADWDLDEIDLEDCINKGSIVRRNRKDTKDSGFQTNDLDITPKSSMVDEEIKESSSNTGTLNGCVEKEDEDSHAKVSEALNKTLSPVSTPLKPKTNRHLTASKGTPKTPNMQPELYSKVCEEDEDVEDTKSPKEKSPKPCNLSPKNTQNKQCQKTPKTRISSPSATRTDFDLRTPNSQNKQCQKTPKTRISSPSATRTDFDLRTPNSQNKQCQKTPKTSISSPSATRTDFGMRTPNSSKNSPNTPKTECVRKTPKSGQKTPKSAEVEKSQKAANTRTATNSPTETELGSESPVKASPTKNSEMSEETEHVEQEKELENNNFDEGLTEEDKSSTRVFEETKETADKSKRYSLHCLLNKNIDDEEDLDTLINQLETSGDDLMEDPTENDVAEEKIELEHDHDAMQEDNDDTLEEEMTIFQKFIGLNTGNENEEEKEINISEKVSGGDCNKQDNEVPEKEDESELVKEPEEDVDDFENLLNEDLSKALEKALGEDDVDMLHLNDEEPSANAEKDEETVQAQKETPQEVLLKASNQNPHSKYSKTNQKARNIKGKPVIPLQENALKPKNQKVLAPRLANKGNEKQNVGNNGNVQALKQKICSTGSISIKSPKTNKENQGNNITVNKEELRKCPKTNLKTENSSLPQKHINVKREKIIPSRCFINTQRGERTPIKLYDLLLEQSPKSKEKHMEDSFKQSPKSKEKTGEKICVTANKRTPDNTLYKKSPTQCKKNLSDTVLADNITTCPTADAKVQTNVVRTSQRSISVSPQGSVQTPQKIRNVSVKLQRLSPNISPSNSSQQSPTNLRNSLSPGIKTLSPSNKTTALTLKERESFGTVFKLPSGITVSKVNANTSPVKVDITPSRSKYCKQNFTEQQVVVAFQDNVPTPATHFDTLINNLPTTVTVTKSNKSIAQRLRVRQASIDIVQETKSPKKSALDYKSYAVSRSARKKEVLQRMRTIKKQIIKSIELNSLVNVKEVKTPLIRKRKRSAIQIENVEILPNVEEDVLTPILGRAQTGTSPLITAHQEEAENQLIPKHVVEEQNEITKVMASEAPENTPPENIPIQNKIRKSLITPESVANADKSPELNSQPSASLGTPTSKPKDLEQETAEPSTPRRTAKKPAKTPTTGKRGRPWVRKRPASPLLEECPPKRAMKSSELESTQLGLSASVVDFLQRDLKANRINVDSLLNEPMPLDDVTPDQTPQKAPAKKHNNRDQKNDKQNGQTGSSSDILDDLMKQVTTEPTTDETKDSNEVPEADPNCLVEDYDSSKDLKLLEKFGLKIITIQDIEDLHTIEIVEEMRAKARQFSDICRQFPRIFICSKLTEFIENFKILNTQINTAFGENVSLSDTKRLINLIILWYTNCYNFKLIDKKPMSESTNHYLLAFDFIPKTSKRTYYCEFCDERFYSENKYALHRLQHTGAQFPYKCAYCSQGFQRLQPFKVHSAMCAKKEQAAKQQPTKTMTTRKLDTLRRISVKADSAVVEPEAKRRTMYKCAKCEVGFSTELEVKAHVKTCNRFQTRQLKATPRPKTKVEPYSRN